MWVGSLLWATTLKWLLCNTSNCLRVGRFAGTGSISMACKVCFHVCSWVSPWCKKIIYSTILWASVCLLEVWQAFTIPPCKLFSSPHKNICLAFILRTRTIYTLPWLPTWEEGFSKCQKLLVIILAWRHFPHNPLGQEWPTDNPLAKSNLWADWFAKSFWTIFLKLYKRIPLAEENLQQWEIQMERRSHGWNYKLWNEKIFIPPHFVTFSDFSLVTGML